MIATTIVVGAVLCLVGLGFRFGTGTSSITALIPMFFGLPILILGFLAKKESLKKHAIHGALFFALLGFLGSFSMGMKKWPALFTGGVVENPNSGWAQLIMAVLCGALLFVGIRSFVAARKAA